MNLEMSTRTSINFILEAISLSGYSIINCNTLIALQYIFIALEKFWAVLYFSANSNKEIASKLINSFEIIPLT